METALPALITFALFYLGLHVYLTFIDLPSERPPGSWTAKAFLTASWEYRVFCAFMCAGILYWDTLSHLIC